MRRALPGLIAAVVLASSFWLSPAAFAAPAPTSIDTLLGGLIDDVPLPIPLPPAPPRLTGIAHQPFSVTVGVGGRLYVADPVHHVVRFVHQLPCDGFCVGEDVFAGNGAMGTGADGPDATKAQLAGPYAVAEDPQTQDVYIADTYGHQIRRVTEPPPSETPLPRAISTIAGTGAFGFSGDGVDATKAQLNSPYGIAFWRNPNGRHQTILYVADTLNNRVRAVYLGGTGRNGTIATVAGTGEAGEGGDNGPALSARLNAPRGLAVDPGSGALFIADTFNNRVRRLNPAFDPATGALSATSTIGPVAGTGKQGNAGDGGPATSAQLNAPASVALAQIGLLIADTGNNEIRVVSNGNIGKFAGAGAPAPTPLSSPFGVAAVPAPVPGGSPPPNSQVGDIFIADTGSNLVRIVSFVGSGGVAVTPYAGNGTPGLASPFQNMALDGATAVVQDPSSGQRVRFVLDTFNHSVRQVPSIPNTIGDPPLIGNGLPGSTKDGTVTSNRTQQLHLPLGVTLVPPPPGIEFGDTLIYVADTFNNAVRLITEHANGTVTISTVAGIGSPGFSGDSGPATQAKLSFPTGLAVDAAGNLFIADTYNARIRRVDAAPPHNITTVAGTGTLGSDGDNGPATNARLFFPLGIAADQTGNLFIADSFANRVRRVDATTQSITTIAGPGTLNRPWGIAFDGFGGLPGTLLISDFLDHVVRALDLKTGTLTTLAGTLGKPGFSGDPGAPGGARLDGPRGIMVAPDFEEFLVADSFSNRIRILGTPAFSGTGLDLGIADRTTFPNNSVTITNLGTGLLELGAVTVDPAGDPGFNANFFPSCSNTHLAARQSCSHLAEYFGQAPLTHSGPATSRLIVHDPAGNVIGVLALQAEVPNIGAIADIAFPDTIVGSPRRLVQTIVNTGTAPLKITGFAFSGTNAGDFTVAATLTGGNPQCSTTMPLAPGARCDVGITFTPGATGPRSATLTIRHNVPGSDTSVKLTGNGIPTPGPR